MNIKPKIPMYLEGNKVVKFINPIVPSVTGVGRTSDNWYNDIHIYQMDDIINRLKDHGEDDSYMLFLNGMLHEHSKIWNLEKSKMDRPEFRDYVKLYQLAYSGNDYAYPFFNDGDNTRRFQLQNGKHNDYNLLGIAKAFENGVFLYPGKRTSMDSPNWNYSPDGYFSRITDYRRLLGREGDWDEKSDQFKYWLRRLNNIGYETYLDKSDGYYKLRRLTSPETFQGVMPKTEVNPDLSTKLDTKIKETGGVDPKEKVDRESFIDVLRAKLQNAAPGILDSLRLAGNLYNNERVFNEVMKGIRPNLLQSYLTHRQVVGDEATKLAYYRRAALGLTKAALPFTADADRLMAYMNEAKRIGDELRALGDLVDNLEIRRTSDESNQHLWANIQRNTEVANRNLIELNQANAAKQLLKALKHTADWTNWDNYLMGIQARAEQKINKLKAILDLVELLTMLDGLYDDPHYKAAYENLRAISKKHTDSLGNIDWNHPDILAASRALQKAKNLYFINYYKLKSAKSGTKLTYKDESSKYLYKTSKDIVDHFRRITKMADDSRIKSRTNPIKLSSHPKPRRMQQGGIAPFTIYRPLNLGGESAVSTQTTSSEKSSSTKDTAAKDKLDMIKELFKSIKGLPVDVTAVYKDIMNTLNKAKTFGEELTTDDLASMYLSSMLKMAQLKYSEDAFEKAKALATTNEALNEIAVGTNGEMVFLDLDTGKIKLGTIRDYFDKEKNLNPLTNDQILEMRAKSPNMVFDDKILNIVNNGIGMNKVASLIKSIAGTLGSSEQKIEGISLVESNKIKQGLLILAGAPDGYYKVALDSKDSKANVQAALQYIYNMLPKNYKTMLELHSNGNGLKLIEYYLTSQTNDFLKYDINPLTGKAAKDANENSKSGSGTDTPASVLFLLGNGYSEIVEFNIGNSQSVKALGRFGILLDKEKNNLGLGSNFLDVSKSLFGPILDMDKATFGGSRLNSNGYSHIILNNSDCIGLDLPVKRDLSGNYVPDFLLLSLIEKAEEQIHNNRITDPKLINKIYKDLGLPEKFDSNGNIILQNYRRFAGILVILDSKALKGGAPLNVDEISEADDTERELFIEAMKKENKDYDLSDGFLWSNWGRDKLYKGTIFVPVREDIVSGYISGGYPLDTDLPNNANKVAIMLYAPKTLLYQKTPPLSSLK